MRTTEPAPTAAEPATGTRAGRRRRGTSTTRGVLAGTAALVVVAAALGVAMLHRDSRPPQLRLTSLGPGGVAGGASAGSGPAPQLGAPAEGAGSGGSRYLLRGTLPTGPDHAAVRRFSTPADADARALAVSLADAAGISGTPRRVDGRWEVSSGSRVVRVAIAPGTPWTYARDDATACLPLPGAAPDSVVSCGAASGSAPGTTPAPVPGDQALAAAGPLLRAVGLEPRAAHLVSPGATSLVMADPVVDGLATVGLGTSVVVDRDGVVTAQGWAPRVVRGDTYPLVTARDAFEVLQRQPQPMIACRAPADERPGERPSAPPPGCGSPLVVVGAELGLGLQWSGENPLLVPTWLFALDGSDLPVPVLAVQPEYVGTGQTPSGSATPELGGPVPLPDPTGGLPSPGLRPGTPRSP